MSRLVPNRLHWKQRIVQRNVDWGQMTVKVEDTDATTAPDTPLVDQKRRTRQRTVTVERGTCGPDGCSQPILFSRLFRRFR